jgi:CRISPR-associated protein Csm4
MTSYKIIWESLSPYSTALMSDTIFGHFAWAVRYLKGASLLQELISELRQKPSLVFSSAFPSGKLPLPCLPYPNDLKDRFPQWTQHRKKLKALEYLETEEFCTPGWKFCWLDFFTKSLTGLPAPSAQPKQDLVFHNSIDRLSGTTSAGGGNLYAAETTFVPDGYIWDSYLRIDTSFLTVEDIKAIFAYISETGFGKDKSTGKGRFRITLTEYSFPLPEKANAWLNLPHPCLL